MPAPLTVSIVSHGHNDWVTRLLQDLARTAGHQVAHVIVTHNLPAPSVMAAGTNWPFAVTELVNAAPAGFAANHNRAFARAVTPLFCILNPDISLPDPQIWSALAATAGATDAGCVFPTLVNPDGTLQDNRRAAPTPWALFRRRLLGHGEPRMDWVSAAFWVVPAPVYAQLGGLDERFHLYCEDVDFCLRLQLAGWRLVAAPAQAIHHAQRSSHRRWRHLRWHLASLLRLWLSPVLWRYLWRRNRIPTS